MKKGASLGKWLKPAFVLFAVCCLAQSVDQSAFARSNNQPPPPPKVDEKPAFELAEKLGHQPELLTPEYLKYLLGHPAKREYSAVNMTYHWQTNRGGIGTQYCTLTERRDANHQLVQAILQIDMPESDKTLVDVQKRIEGENNQNDPDAANGVPMGGNGPWSPNGFMSGNGGPPNNFLPSTAAGNPNNGFTANGLPSGSGPYANNPGYMYGSPPGSPSTPPSAAPSAPNMNGPNGTLGALAGSQPLLIRITIKNHMGRSCSIKSVALLCATPLCQTLSSPIHRPQQLPTFTESRLLMPDHLCLRPVN